MHPNFPGLLALLVDELQGISALALLAPQEELEIIVASAAAVNRWGQVELAGALGPGSPWGPLGGNQWVHPGWLVDNIG